VASSPLSGNCAALTAASGTPANPSMCSPSCIPGTADQRRRAGVELLNHPRTWGGHTTGFFAVGTAVTPLRDDHVIAKPTMVLGLDT
jgi:hypothetical protein